MKLDVLPAKTPGETWYADGLNFTCTQCGNCCTGGPGFVWVTPVEIERLAEFLELTPTEVVEQFCRKVGERISFNERRNLRGEFDCTFLREEKLPPAKDGTVTQSRRGCSIYPVRPLQCRTWPFWPENLTTEARWNLSGRRCHGINQGRHFTIEEIARIRDARDWPEKPPTSGK